jgi:ferric-dicitrate binding protein FerR (iron transport regulator)
MHTRMNSSVDVADLLRYLSGESSEGEALRVRAWRDASKANAALLTALRHAGEVDPAPLSIDIVHAIERLHNRLDTVADPIISPIWLAAAPHTARQVSAPLFREHRGPSRVAWYALFGVILGGIIFAAGWHREMPRYVQSTQTAVGAAATIYTTGPGEQQAFGLSDGSTVALGEASRLEVPPDFRAGGHPIRVQGEAAFTVQHQSGDAFTVSVSGTRVRVLGTTFMVRHYASDTTTVVMVRYGKVMVRAGGMRTMVLTDAQQVVIGQQAMHVAPINGNQLYNLKGGNMNPMLLLYSLATTAGATPAVPTHTDVRAVVDSNPILTVDVLTRMTAFWTVIYKEKEDLVIAQAQDNVDRDRINPILEIGANDSEISYGLPNMVGLTADDPRVAAALQQVGLTGKQFNSYNTALFSALLTDQRLEQHAADSVPLTPVQVANIRLLKEHIDEFKAYRDTGLKLGGVYYDWMFGPKTAAALSHYK